MVVAALCLLVFLLRLLLLQLACPLGAYVGCGGRVMASGVATGVGIFNELWVDSAMSVLGGTSAFRRCGVLLSGARGMGSLFRVRAREVVSIRSRGSDASIVYAMMLPTALPLLVSVFGKTMASASQAKLLVFILCLLVSLCVL